eukprot:COSAG01_NODE_10937_length_2043_cov_24.532922_2_plen_123_part_00
MQGEGSSRYRTPRRVLSVSTFVCLRHAAGLPRGAHFNAAGYFSPSDLYLSQGRKAFNPHFTAQTNMAAAARFPGGAVVQPLRKLLGSKAGVPVLIMVVTVYGLGVDWRLAFVLATLCKPPPD